MSNNSYVNQTYRNRIIHYRSARASLRAYARTGAEEFNIQCWNHLVMWAILGEV